MNCVSGYSYEFERQPPPAVVGKEQRTAKTMSAMSCKKPNFLLGPSPILNIR